MSRKTSGSGGRFTGAEAWPDLLLIAPMGTEVRDRGRGECGILS